MWNPFRKIRSSNNYRKTIEEHIGRPLKEGEIVHHKNGDRNDNRIKNLKITYWSWHARQHIIDTWLKREVNPKIDRISDSMSDIRLEIHQLNKANEELRNSFEKLENWMETNCPVAKEIIAKNEENR